MGSRVETCARGGWQRGNRHGGRPPPRGAPARSPGHVHRDGAPIRGLGSSAAPHGLNPAHGEPQKLLPTDNEPCTLLNVALERPHPTLRALGEDSGITIYWQAGPRLQVAACNRGPGQLEQSGLAGLAESKRFFSAVVKRIFVRIELGGSSVAVRTGAQLGVSVTSSMSSNSLFK